MVTVKLFAAAADAAGRRLIEGDWAGLTPAQLLQVLQEQYPGLGKVAPVLAIAVNREYATPDQILQEGDEVALIPPVSGGSTDTPANLPPRFEITEEPLSADEIAARVTNPYSGATLVFVEVRSRRRSDFGGAAASVTAAKQHKLAAAARQYLAGLKTTPACRFDVVALEGDAPPAWIRNAFDDMG